MKGEQVEFALSPKHLRSPAVLSRGGFDFAPDGADVNRLAAIAAEIFTKLLHAENFNHRHLCTLCILCSQYPCLGFWLPNL